MQPASLSRFLTIALFIAITVLSFDPPMVFLALEDRTVRRHTLSRRADPDPALAAFLAGVRARTKNGDAIQLVLPVPSLAWTPYSQRFFRASYLLAGRKVLPMITPEGVVDLQSFADADYVAIWGLGQRVQGEPVWNGHGGVLVKRP